MSYRHIPSTSRFITRGLVVLAWLGSLVAIAIGGTICAGWFLGIDALLAVVVMKTEMAVGVLLSGIALMLLMPSSMSRVRRWGGRCCAGIVLLLGALTLLEQLIGWDPRIDEVLLALGTPGAAGTVSSARMGPLGSLSLVLIGAALLALSRRRRRRCLWQPLAIVTGLLGFLPILDYLYGAQELYGPARAMNMALPTAVCVLALSLGLLCARPKEGRMALVTSSGPGGVTVRRLLLPALLLPVLLGWLRLLGERKGLYGAELGTALVILTILVGFTALVWHSGSRLDGVWAKEARDSEEQFRTMADAIPHLAWIADAQGSVCWFNRRWYEFTGVTETQFAGGGGWKTVLDPKTIPEVLDRWRASILAGEPLEIEFHLRGDNGRFRWFLTRAMPVKDSEGRVERWLGTHTDINEKREAEEALAAKISDDATSAEAERAGKAKDESSPTSCVHP